jgi:hypothetical protein
LRRLIYLPFDSAWQLIVLSASANKLSKLKEQAEEYALLIMEELDPEDLGYIEVNVRTSAVRIYVSHTCSICTYLT